MRVLVNATAAETGGAATIVQLLFNEFLNSNENYTFLLSSQIVFSKKNIQVICINDFKKSIIHRLYFSVFKLRKLIESEKYDLIINLNHTYIYGLDVKQKIILHQSLPFSDCNFSIVKDFKLWFKKNISGIYTKHTLKRVNYIETPSYWLKNALIKKIAVNPEKIIVKPPNVKLENLTYEQTKKSNKLTFIYPSGNLSYKNINILLESIKLIRPDKYSAFEILLTLNENNSRKLKRLSDKSNIPVKFIGYIDKINLYKLYSTSVLIYLSSVEAFGLPLLEAKLLNIPIIALKRNYAYEILNQYEKVTFVDLDKKEIAKAIEHHIESGNY